MTDGPRFFQRSTVARRWFSLLAPGYDAVSSVFWPEPLQREGIDRLEIDPDDRVLDIGCGTGATAELLGRQAAEVHGLDQSLGQLERALEKEALKDVCFVRANAQSLPYPASTFDRVASIGSILYWADPSTVLEEAFRVTNPGGMILVMGFHRRPISPWNPFHNAQTTINSMLYYQYDSDEATELFDGAGWRNVEHEITGPDWSTDLVISTTARKPASREK